MATKVDSGITSSDAQYAQRYSADIYNESVVKNSVMKYCMEYGVINKEDALTKEDGGTVTLYNRPRVNSQGLNGDVDFYSNAELQETNSRTINISKVTYAFRFKGRGTQDEQYSPYNLSDGTAQNASDWMGGIVSASLINQLAGNNATSINQPSLDDSAFTGATLLNVTGNNAASAPSYWYEANDGGAITTAAGIDSVNTFSIKDLEVAERVITGQQAGVPTFQTFVNKDCMALVFISKTHKHQLLREASTLGQAPQLQEYMKAALAGGKKVGAMEEFEIPGYSFKLVCVPDSWMPRAVTTSGTAETANTRRAFIVGRNAIDVCFGRGFTMPTVAGGTGTQGGGKANSRAVSGVNINLDPNYKRLNNEVFGTVSLLWGAKKVRVTGSGSNSGNSYDLASYVIDSYSAS